ncbi:MAG: zinc ribbon domain-containing protein, partial [bacterium]
MDDGYSKYCRRCGAPLSEGVKFCESCGAKIPDEKPRQTEVPDGGQETHQPDDTASVFDVPPTTESAKTPEEFEFSDNYPPPRVQIAASNAWAMLNQDIVGGLVVFLIVVVFGVGVGFMSTFGLLAMLIFAGPLEVGFLGWAEAKRRGKAANPDVFFKTGFGNFPSALLLGIVTISISLLWMVFLVVGYISIVFG